LRTLADQVAASLLSIKLGEDLRQAKEIEAFQTTAAFFVHDLKNLASKLSMMLQNLPVHFSNPAFRDDALCLMSQSVDRINAICSRLSLLREKLEIRPVETDLNELVSVTLAGLDGLPNGCLVENLQSVPRLFVDPEQIRKVLTNLILNAREAVGDRGEIRVTTGRWNSWVELTSQMRPVRKQYSPRIKKSRRVFTKWSRNCLTVLSRLLGK
jgi:signal transduction histidine kinase